MDIAALLEVLVKEILEAEEKFLKNPRAFYGLETAVKSSAESFSAGFLGTVLTSMNERLCKYLFIEADEDHVAEQHGRWTKENSGFISHLAYIYEYKQESPKVKGRKELVNTYYFGGLYEGSR